MKGTVVDKDGEAKYVINGTWDSKVEIAPVTKIDKESGSWQTGAFTTAWQRVLPPLVFLLFLSFIFCCNGFFLYIFIYLFIIFFKTNRSDSDKYYNFTELACQLNEMEERIAPTDSRLRPDQRLMELGMWDEANIEKLRLEEKQRQKRKERHMALEDTLENGKPYSSLTNFSYPLP